jgi:hypothetical protein
MRAIGESTAGTANNVDCLSGKGPCFAADYTGTGGKSGSRALRNVAVLRHRNLLEFSCCNCKKAGTPQVFGGGAVAGGGSHDAQPRVLYYGPAAQKAC